MTTLFTYLSSASGGFTQGWSVHVHITVNLYDRNERICFTPYLRLRLVVQVVSCALRQSPMPYTLNSNAAKIHVIIKQIADVSSISTLSSSTLERMAVLRRPHWRAAAQWPPGELATHTLYLGGLSTGAPQVTVKTSCIDRVSSCYSIDPFWEFRAASSESVQHVYHAGTVVNKCQSSGVCSQT